VLDGWSESDEGPSRTASGRTDEGVQGVCAGFGLGGGLHAAYLPNRNSYVHEFNKIFLLILTEITEGVPQVGADDQPRWTLFPRSPAQRMTRRMHAGDDHELITGDAVVKAVWEAAQEDPPCTAMDDGIGVWLLADRLHRLLYGREELASQAEPLLLIPLVGCLDVGRSGGPKSHLLHRLRP